MSNVIVEERGVTVLDISHEEFIKNCGLISIAHLPFNYATLDDANGNRSIEISHTGDERDLAELHIEGVSLHSLPDGYGAEVEVSKGPYISDSYNPTNTGYRVEHKGKGIVQMIKSIFS